MRRASLVFALAASLAVSAGGGASLAQVVPPPVKEEVIGRSGAEVTAPEDALPEGEAAEPSPAQADPAAPPRLLAIGAAPVAGTFFPTAGAICREINRRQAENGLRCLVQESEGSADNIQRLRAGELELAIVQSDWAYHALNGSASDRAPPFTNLYSLALLQPQMMTLVAASGSAIEAPADLAGKRVSVGPADSSLNVAGRNLLQMLGLSQEVQVLELPVEQEVQALCEGEIDAFLLPAVHPSALLESAVASCGARLIGMNGGNLDGLIATWPFFVRASLPPGLYAGQENEVRSYGTVATLVATDALSEEAAYRVVKALFEGVADLQAQHPSLQLLQPEAMVGPSGMAAPLHAGALRYYTERGWR